MRLSKIALVVGIACCGQVQADDEFLDDISLEDLLNITVTVASGGKGMTLRESPGIVSLITKDEIVNSGARDLMDVLMLVPGISFAMDVQGVVGITARGNWSHEGKISLMVDDMEMNDLSYGTLQFGNHFPVENIERIEIIRGPGSAIYGGFAEMGVIKIITKNAQTLKATEGSVMVGQMNDGASRVNGNLAFGKQFENGSISANAFYTAGERSDRMFSDFYEDTYDMKGNSDIDSFMLNLSAKYGGFSARYLLDDYVLSQRDIFFVNAPFPVDEGFKSEFYDFKYDWQASDSLTVSPQLNIKKQQPWKSNSQAVIDLENDDPDSYSGQFFDEHLQRTTMKVTASYDFDESDNLIMGVSRYTDEDKTVNVKYNSKAIFAQTVMKMDIGNVTAGARWEDHSEAGSSFLPRLGYTNVWDKSHLKVLWSTAFRAPVIQNILDFSDPSGESEQIKPESTTVLEIETGYQFSDNYFMTFNFYDIEIEDPIVYYYDDSDRYQNYDVVSTQGFELEGRYKDTWGYVTMNYSYYRVSENAVDQYAVRAIDPDLDDDEMPLVTSSELLGVSPQKMTVAASIKFGDNWRFNPSLVHESAKYGYVGVTQDDDEQLIPEKLDAHTSLNMNFIRDQFMSDKITLQFGVHNLLNDEIDYVQPYYDGYHAPLPGASREVFVKFKFKF